MLITWLERCQKRKGRQGEKGIARSLKHHGTVHGQPYRGGKLFPNRRLSSVNNGLIAGLSTHHNQSENKTRSEGEAGEILGGRLNLHGNVVLKSWNFVSSAWGAQIVSLHFFLYFWQEVGRRNQGRSQKGRCHFVLLHLLLTLSFVWAMGDPAVNPCPSERTRPCRNVQRGDHKALKGTHLCAWKQQWPEDSERCVIRGTEFLPSSLWLCNSSVSFVPFLQPAGTLWGSWAAFQAAELKPGGGQGCPASALALLDCGVPGSLVKNCLELCGIKWEERKRVHFCRKKKKKRSFVSGLIYLTPSQRCSFTYGLVFILVYGKKITILRCQSIPFQK